MIESVSNATTVMTSFPEREMMDQFRAETFGTETIASYPLVEERKPLKFRILLSARTAELETKQ